jgi:hypothetical protein
MGDAARECPLMGRVLGGGAASPSKPNKPNKPPSTEAHKKAPGASPSQPTHPAHVNTSSHVHATTATARYTKIDIADANHMIGRLTPYTLRYITIHAP